MVTKELNNYNKKNNIGILFLWFIFCLIVQYKTPHEKNK